MAMKLPWEGALPPFRIFGNLYFAGTEPASTHLIDTGDGLIVLDAGYQQSLYLVIDSVYKLGFRPEDIRIILLSHGHYDHLGAAAALAKLSGARIYLGAQDAPLADGSVDLTWAKELGQTYRECFVPDVLLHDGDRICLGNTEILCLSTPGHTAGTFSFFFDVTDGERKLRCGMFGGAGVNSMELPFLDAYGLSYDCRTDYVRSLRRLKKEYVDIFLGNHAGNNDTVGKYLHMRETGENLFLDTNEEWQRFLTKLENKMLNKIAQETPQQLAEL